MVLEILGAKINPKSSFKNNGAQNTRGAEITRANKIVYTTFALKLGLHDILICVKLFLEIFLVHNSVVPASGFVPLLPIPFLFLSPPAPFWSNFREAISQWMYLRYCLTQTGKNLQKIVTLLRDSSVTWIHQFQVSREYESWVSLCGGSGTCLCIYKLLWIAFSNGRFPREL